MRCGRRRGWGRSSAHLLAGKVRGSLVAQCHPNDISKGYMRCKKVNSCRPEASMPPLVAQKHLHLCDVLFCTGGEDYDSFIAFFECLF